MIGEFEREYLLKEHEYIASSLMKNREKGVQRFTLYVVVIGGIFAFLGIKDGSVLSINSWLLAATFLFLSILGWLLLLTLTRRSISTELHLGVLAKIRKTILIDYGSLDAILPLKEGNYDFEIPKGRYVYRESRRSSIVLRALGTRMRYGDLIENVCILNCLVWTFFITWFLHAVWLESHPLWPGIILSVFTVAWLWTLQRMYVWYQHLRGIEKDLLNDERKAHRQAKWIAAVGGLLILLYLNTEVSSCSKFIDAPVVHPSDEGARSCLCRAARNVSRFFRSIDKYLVDTAVMAGDQADEWSPST